MKALPIAAVACVGLLLLFPSCGQKERTNKRVPEVTLEKAKEKGKGALKELGYDVENMRVRGDEDNRLWKEYVAKTPSVMESTIIKPMRLEEKTYWAIHYGPIKRVRGGGAWVFVDVNTGEIIGILRGR